MSCQVWREIKYNDSSNLNLNLNNWLWYNMDRGLASSDVLSK